MKDKFFKNLYQSISFFAVILILDIPLLAGYIVSLDYENNNGWILLLIATLLTALFFIIGFYWIFQIVEINDSGITTKLFKKVIKNISWENVAKIEYGNVMRNSSYTVIHKDGNKINIDARKEIRQIIKKYSDNYDSVLFQKITKDSKRSN